MKPLLRWAGGKTQLLDKLLPMAPKTIETYVEPFVGGGALFFAIADRCKRAVICDMNAELIHFYKVVRDNPHALIEEFTEHPARYENDEEQFYAMRGAPPHALLPIERAARFLYLNKTCFNGLWRVNRKGEFNVPFGRRKKVTVCEAASIFEASAALKKTSVRGGALIVDDFAQAIGLSRTAGDFVYCDPPYDPVGDASFTAYAKAGFTWEDHKRLEIYARAAAKRGAKVVLSNAYTERVRELYGNSGWQLTRVMAARAINSDGKGRGKVQELIITRRRG